jgi:hypothetical protein
MFVSCQEIMTLEVVVNGEAIDDQADLRRQPHDQRRLLQVAPEAGHSGGYSGCVSTEHLCHFVAKGTLTRVRPVLACRYACDAFRAVDKMLMYEFKDLRVCDNIGSGEWEGFDRHVHDVLNFWF